MSQISWILHHIKYCTRYWGSNGEQRQMFSCSCGPQFGISMCHDVILLLLSLFSFLSLFLKIYSTCWLSQPQAYLSLSNCKSSSIRTPRLKGISKMGEQEEDGGILVHSKVLRCYYMCLCEDWSKQMKLEPCLSSFCLPSIGSFKLSFGLFYFMWYLRLSLELSYS